MKKKLSVAMAVLMGLCCAPTAAFARTDNYVNTVKSVMEDYAFTMDNAPELVIESSSDHEGDFSFVLTLSSGSWNYEGTGTITEGVTYRKLTGKMLSIEVDMDTFDAAQEDIRIPMYVTVEGEGEVTVTVDPGESMVSPGTYQFAQSVSDSTITVSVDRVESISDNGTLSDIVIHDSGSSSYSEGERIKLELTNGFQFVSGSIPIGTGKFEDKVDFQIDENDKSTAYVVLTGNTTGTSGRIVLRDVKIRSTSSSEYGSVGLTVSIKGNSGRVSVANRAKNDTYDVVISINTIEGNERPTISGTAAAKKTVVVTIDGVEIGKATTDYNGNWSIDYVDYYKALSAGEHTVNVAYYRTTTGTTTGDVSKTFTVEETEPELPAVSRIAFTVGAVVYEKDGELYDLDVPAMVDEAGRTLLPVRAVANALGIGDDQIAWDEQAQKVTITGNDGTVVELTIGESRLFVNGEERTFDSKAIIQDGRTMLPMRAVLNALGVSDDQIDWYDGAKRVTVMIENY